MKQKKARRNLLYRSLAILLIVVFVIPAGLTGAAVAEENVATPVGIVIPVVHGGARSSVGITPEELNDMALDPQSWRLPHDTRHSPIAHLGVTTDTRRTDLGPDGDIVDTRYSFVRHPVVEWQYYRAINDDPNDPRTFDDMLQFPGTLERRTIRGAVLLVEFPDKPMFASREQGSELMGNPQVDTGIHLLSGEARAQALRDFWRTFLNEHQPDLNRGHNITGSWLEYSMGMWDKEMEVFGPVMVPHFRFMYPPTSTFWSNTTSAAQREIWGNFNFHGQFPQHNQAVSALATSIAIEQGMMALVDPATGAPLFDLVYFTFAGYCQSPTWQEFGSMMFPYPTGVITTTDVAHPVTREILPGVTGMDFTGYAHVRNLHEIVSAPDFDIYAEFGPGFFMTNVQGGWRTYVSTGANATAFTTTRDRHEGLFEGRNAIPAVVVPNPLTITIDGVPTVVAVSGSETDRTVGASVKEAYIEFRVQFPNSTITPVQFRNSVLRPVFLDEFAMQRRYEGLSMPSITPLLNAIDALGPLTIEVVGETGANTAAANNARLAAIAATIRALPQANAAGVVVRFDLFGATGNDWTTGNFRAHVNHGYEVVTIDLNIAAFVPPGDVITAFSASIADYSEFAFAEEEADALYNYAFRADGQWFVNGEVFEGDPESIDDAYFPFAVHPAETGATAAQFGIAAFSAVPRPDWVAFQQARSPETVVPRLIELLEEAMDEAANHPTNPYFQAAPTRYVPWTSWYGVFGVWSHATNMNVFHPNVGNVQFGIAVQGEGAAMAVYSHELGHVIRLPDNDNMVYTIFGGVAGTGAGGGAGLPVRSLIGPWNIMARGAHVGYYGGHTRWNVPGIRGGSSGTGLMARMRIGSGFTDLTTNHGPTPGATGAAGRENRNWVRDDYYNSRDVLYVPYTTFRAGPPVVGEIHGRNIPTNRGFVDYYGDPIDGYTALVIQGLEFRDQTPGINTPRLGTTNATRWGNNLLGVDINNAATNGQTGINILPTLQQSPVHASGNPLMHRSTIIDPNRWNWSIGGMGGTVSELTFGLPPTWPQQRQAGFTMEVINRVGSDSFSPDHGVLIARTGHMNIVNQGGMDNPGIFLIDPTPGNNNMIQFREADGTPYFFGCDHHAQISDAAFRAGVHNNPYFYRDIFPERFLPMEPCGNCSGGCRNLPDLMRTGVAPPAGRGVPVCYDPRPGWAGGTVNEWVDEFNNFHFYILQRNNHRGRFGEFISYDVAVRNTAVDAYSVGGVLELVTVGDPIAASPGNFSAQKFALTACNDATATDIIRVLLEGELAEAVTVTTVGGYTYKAHTMDQNVVILNNLFGIEPGETIEFYVFIRVPANHTGPVFDTTGRLDVTARSETNSDKYATAGGPEVNVPFTLSFDIFNNGNNNNASLATAGVIRMWPQINGVGSNLTYANLTITAYDQDNNPAMQFIRVNRIWNNLNYVSLIDANKHAPWQYIDLTVTYRGQVFEVRLINNMYLSLRAFNNGTCAEVPSMAGSIRIWPQLGGVSALIPMSAVITAVDQDGNNAIDRIVRNRQWTDAGWQNNYVNFDVDKNAPWETILFTVTAFGQEVEVLLINNLFEATQGSALSLNAFNNGDSRNASLDNLGVIRIWTRLDGVNALVPYADLTVTAVDQDGNPAMEFVRVNRIWNNLGYVNLIDVTKRNANWETIDLTVRLGDGQPVELLLVNDLFP